MVDVKLSMCKWKKKPEEAMIWRDLPGKDRGNVLSEHSPHAWAGYSNGHNSSEGNTCWLISICLDVQKGLGVCQQNC